MAPTAAQAMSTGCVYRTPQPCPRMPKRCCRSLTLRQRGLRVCASAAGAPSKVPKQQMLVYVPPHPLVKHWLAVVRNHLSPPPVFKCAVAELGRILIYEAGREWLPTVDMDVMTPMGVLADATVVDPAKPVKVVPVLRAGLVLLDQASTVLPSQEVYHVGMVRDEETLQASWYLNKLPEKLSPDDRVLVADVMLATGGTIVQVLDDIVARGALPSNIRLVTVLAAPPALTKLSEKYPGMAVYTAMIDAEVDDKGFIVPGLGDAGDRAYGTGSSSSNGGGASA